MEAYHIDRFGSVDGIVLRSSGCIPRGFARDLARAARFHRLRSAPTYIPIVIASSSKAGAE